jgi:transposase-like protein
MSESIRGGAEVQAVTWETLGTWLEGKVQALLQEVLEAEVTELLGRCKSQRRAPVEAPAGYRNGYGKPRQLTLGGGTIRLRRPRVRGLEERFESRVLPLFVRRSQEVSALLPELYLHGLAEGDFDLALRGLLGEEAALSASTVARLKSKWQAELSAWKTRPLGELEVVYLWVDGVYVKAGLEDRKAALLVAMAGLSDGRKVVLAVQSGQRESTESWSRLLRDLRARGLRAPRLVIGDGHLGIWAALRNVYPEAQEQRCWNHRMVNVLDRIGRRDQVVAKGLLREIVYAETVGAAERAKAAFQGWCRERGYEEAGWLLEEDWERMVTFFRFPKEHWSHLRTTNPVESPFAALRLRTVAAKRFKRVENATAVIWKLLLLAERKFRRLNAPELLAEVWNGVQFANGIRAEDRPEEVAA